MQERVELKTLSSQSEVAIYVDLDGTLIRSDIVVESGLIAVKRNSKDLILGLLGSIRKRTGLKKWLADRGRPDVAQLPYRQNIVEVLKKERAAGRRLVLATTTTESLARPIAEHLGLFDDVLASTAEQVLKKHEKLKAIQKHCGGNGFEYIGDSRADLPVFEKARKAHVVSSSPSLIKKVKRANPNHVVYEDGRPSFLTQVIRLMRPRHWSKNILLWAPMFLAHEMSNAGHWLLLSLAFLAFGFCASSGYVFNDLLDIEADRHHSEKRDRPFASGMLPVRWGLPLTVCLLLGGFSISVFLLPPAFTAILAAYLVLSMLYSFWIKGVLLVDVLSLGILYTLRIVGGGTVISVTVSHWLLALSIFLFISLAFAKRYVELSNENRDPADPQRVKGRGYYPGDLSLMENIGPSCGIAAVLVLAMYLNSNVASDLYPRPDFAWPLCVLLTYWILRIWFLAKRGELPEDPVTFVVTDSKSYLVGFAGLILFFLASTG